MDVLQLKEYIIENNCIESILEDIKCHNIQYHSSGYWSCGNKDGDNKKAIIVKNNEFLSCNNYTRQMVKTNRATDIIDLVCFNENLSFPEGLKFICNSLGLNYYHNFNDDIPESLLITKLILSMKEGTEDSNEKPLKPISKNILNYYKNYVNDMFYNDNIDYKTQKEFNIGYDEFTNRITIPIFSEIGDLVGVKGRLFKKVLDENDLKYLYIEPCARSKILYGLNKTMPYIKNTGRVYVVEAEKGVLQLWSYGFRNSVATGGKEFSTNQIEMLIRLGSEIVLCLDKDVTKEELEEIADRFVENVPLYYMYDENDILNEKEAPSDNPIKWSQLIKNNIYKLR